MELDMMGIGERIKTNSLKQTYMRDVTSLQEH